MHTIRKRLWVRALATGVIATIGLGLSGCFGGGQVQRDDNGDVVEGNDQADAFSIRVGDCLNDADLSGEVTTAPIVPCSQPHDSEAYARIDVPGTTYPGPQFVQDFADQACYDFFDDFVGIAWEDSTLEFSYYSPTQGSWEQLNDREILCTIYDPEGKTTGTLKNSRR